ncbi:MAG: L,D-transpeptidase [Nitrospirae bacterium]|nr:L,D-transpeptidase [Nitrospirota bacterium]
MSRRCGHRWLAATLIVLAVGAERDSHSRPSSSPCTITYPSDATVPWDCRRLRPGESLERVFGDRWKDVARFNRVDRRHAQVGVALKVPKRFEEIKDFTPLPLRYPPADTEARFILVDLAEQFLGAYEYGRLVFSAPAATGEREAATPAGDFRVTAAHRRHHSSVYTIEGTDIPYPMNDALMFYTDKQGVNYWIHGRDLPGYPASHGCVGLYDEEMQHAYYGVPKNPVLDDARTLYRWVMGSRADRESVQTVTDGPRVLIVGRAP